MTRRPNDNQCWKNHKRVLTTHVKHDIPEGFVVAGSTSYRNCSNLSLPVIPCEDGCLFTPPNREYFFRIFGRPYSKSSFQNFQEIKRRASSQSKAMNKKQSLILILSNFQLEVTLRIIPVSKWLVTPIYKPRMAIWKGNIPILRGQQLTMGQLNKKTNPRMILQVNGQGNPFWANQRIPTDFDLPEITTDKILSQMLHVWNI